MNLKQSTPLLLFLLMLTNCSQKEQTASNKEADYKSIIITTNYPLQFFAQSMLGDLAEVKMVVPKGQDPSHWTPTVDELLEMQKADLVLINGATYEPWIEKSSLAASTIYNTSTSFKDEFIQYQEGPSHSHGSDGEHTHMGTAFTIWLDLDLAAKQALAIKEILIEKFPASSASIETNHGKLAAALLALDKRMSSLSAELKDKRVLFSHPVYQYLQRRYEVEGTSLSWEPNQEIEHDMWHDLEHEVDHHPVKWMIWEDEPISSTKERLEQAGIKSIVFKTISNAPEAGDFLSIMSSNIDQLTLIAGE